MPNYTLINDDCMAYMKTMGDCAVTLCVTDIPYNVVNRPDNGLRRLSKETADPLRFDVEDFLSELVRVVSGSMYVFCSTEQVSQLRGKMVDLGLSTRLVVWEKTNPSPMNGQHLWLSSIECCVFGKKPKATFNEHCVSPVFRFPVPRKTGHPTPKPIALCKRLIEASSNKSDTVFDPCMGGGNIGIAALQADRDFLGVELDKTYFQVAQTNIEKEGL